MKGFEQGCGFGCGCLVFFVLVFMFLTYNGLMPYSSSFTSGDSSSGSGIAVSQGVTLRQYNQLQTGMTAPQIVSILGAGAHEDGSNEIGGIITVSYTWQNTDGSNIIIIMQGGRLVQKTQAGLS
jgi:hypothetical protein